MEQPYVCGSSIKPGDSDTDGQEGLTVVRAMGADELHVIGDWRRVFADGRDVSEVKVKDLYPAGHGHGR
ncbi:MULTISPECIES: hypothetical protein [unclassified Streptomyces]|uniref:hypothetical protein n=1 Tax=unclassified Streptomyces TaxID=2593676 RepID=UPI00365E7632